MQALSLFRFNISCLRIQTDVASKGGGVPVSASSCAGLTQLQGHFKMLWSSCSFWVLGVLSILLVLPAGVRRVCGLTKVLLCMGFVTNVVRKKVVSFACSILFPTPRAEIMVVGGGQILAGGSVAPQSRPIRLCTLAQAGCFPWLMQEL